MTVVAVVQARMGSTRLPGKVLCEVGGRPLVLWTLAAMRAVGRVATVVAAVTEEPADDQLVAVIAEAGYAVHRGPTRDVLTRCWEAVAPYAPEFVIRATADNPFVDPRVVADQLERAMVDGFDYVGTAGWPLGIAAEVARADAMSAAYREAVDPAEREHVMPFLYARPDRFRIGAAPPPTPWPPGRFTVDTSEDLAFARAIAVRLGSVRPVSVDELARIVAAEPALLDLNRDVRQKPWQEAET
jgi:spore coat polysaccharide biosynthesis protein SpsF